MLLFHYITPYCRINLKKHIILISFLIAFSASASGPKVCKGYTCVTYAKGQDGGATIYLESQIREPLLCFLAVDGRKTYFQLTSPRGPFSAGPGVHYTMYRWRCDKATPTPTWYKRKKLPPIGTQTIINRHY